MTGRQRAILTVDLEDYRRQQLRDHAGEGQAPNPQEVERQLQLMLDGFEDMGVRATFFTVGRLTRELSAAVWKRITADHELGCHGHEHHSVTAQGCSAFREDLRRAKSSLEQASGVDVVSYRAPYFSSDGCDPWFGDELGAAGFRFDSSRRLSRPPRDFRGAYSLDGSRGAVQEVPMPSIGFGLKRLTIVGGTYFRVLPLPLIESLLARAGASGFIPMVYLHPYDIDPEAAPLRYPGRGYWKGKAGDWVRRRGRSGAFAKLRALTRRYSFEPLAAQALALTGGA